MEIFPRDQGLTAGQASAPGPNSVIAHIRSCQATSRTIFAQALEASEVSVLAKSYLYPLLHKIDDFLTQMEIWTFDVGLLCTGTDEDMPLDAASTVAATPRILRLVEYMDFLLNKVKRQTGSICDTTERMSTSAANSR